MKAIAVINIGAMGGAIPQLYDANKETALCRCMCMVPSITWHSHKGRDGHWGKCLQKLREGSGLQHLRHKLYAASNGLGHQVQERVSAGAKAQIAKRTTSVHNHDTPTE